MRKNKIFFLFLLLFCLSIPSYCESLNPFLSKKNKKEDTYSENKRTILIVFDASGSMEEKISSETKIHIAKKVLEEVLLNADTDVNIGLRAYGLSEPKGNPYFDCSDSKLLVLPGTSNRRTIISEVYKILPRGFTPITYSLSQAVQDLAPYKGEKTIILISDGLETCGGDPCELAHNISASNIDLKIDVVGFGLQDDVEAQEQLMCISTVTRGKYFSADGANELANSLNESINKSVTGKLITMFTKPVEATTEETEGYEKLPKLQSEKVNLKQKRSTK